MSVLWTRFFFFLILLIHCSTGWTTKLYLKSQCRDFLNILNNILDKYFFQLTFVGVLLKLFIRNFNICLRNPRVLKLLIDYAYPHKSITCIICLHNYAAPCLHGRLPLIFWHLQTSVSQTRIHATINENITLFDSHYMVALTFNSELPTTTRRGEHGW